MSHFHHNSINDQEFKILFWSDFRTVMNPFKLVNCFRLHCKKKSSEQTLFIQAGGQNLKTCTAREVNMIVCVATQTLFISWPTVTPNVLIHWSTVTDMRLRGDHLTFEGEGEGIKKKKKSCKQRLSEEKLVCSRNGINKFLHGCGKKNCYKALGRNILPTKFLENKILVDQTLPSPPPLKSSMVGP